MGYYIYELGIVAFGCMLVLFVVFLAKNRDETICKALYRMCFSKWHFYLLAIYFAYALSKKETEYFYKSIEILWGVVATIFWYAISFGIHKLIAKHWLKKK